MSAKTAEIVDFQEYRQRRVRAPAEAAPVTPSPVMWYPVWVMVPAWPLQAQVPATPSLASG
jgi:hypothetical protein